MLLNTSQLLWTQWLSLPSWEMQTLLLTHTMFHINLQYKTIHLSSSNSRPNIGVDSVSERDTVEGSPAMMHTMASKKLECGAQARMGASALVACLPFTTHRKPRPKKYIRPRAAITVRHRILWSVCTVFEGHKTTQRNELNKWSYS